jgi:glycosyltransferase involved in cell wall biosynthesis
MPAKIVVLDLQDDLQPLLLEPEYDSLKILVRLKTELLGWVDVSAPQGEPRIISRERLANELVIQSSWKVVERHIKNSFIVPPTPASTPSSKPVSIVLCTQKDGTFLQPTLDAISMLQYPHYEVIVVGPRKSSEYPAEETNRRIQYVEGRGGLNSARNRGIEAASHDIIAFIDDSTRVDPCWLQVLADAISRSATASVTGYVAPLVWNRTAQTFIDENFIWVRNRFQPQVFRQTDGTDQELAGPGKFGSGSNMAFQREAFTTCGLFNTKLDVSDWSEDAGTDEMFYRLLKSGRTVSYEPSMLTWRNHDNVQVGGTRPV